MLCLIRLCMFIICLFYFFFFSSRRRHTRSYGDWSSDVCSSDLKCRGVYEVCEVRGGRLVDAPRHLQRLVRSLGELRIALPMALSALGVVLRETVRRNRVGDGLVYLQVTRGIARRDFHFPAADTKPSV